MHGHRTTALARALRLARLHARTASAPHRHMIELAMWAQLRSVPPHLPLPREINAVCASHFLRRLRAA